MATWGAAQSQAHCLRYSIGSARKHPPLFWKNSSKMSAVGCFSNGSGIRSTSKAMNHVRSEHSPGRPPRGERASSRTKARLSRRSCSREQTRSQNSRRSWTTIRTTAIFSTPLCLIRILRDASYVISLPSALLI